MRALATGASKSQVVVLEGLNRVLLKIILTGTRPGKARS